MSAETKAALEEAIATHVADECDNDMIGAWLVISEVTSLNDLDNDVSSFFTDGRETQSSFTTVGLLWHALEHERVQREN